MGNVINLVWTLPRPRRDHYKGGFPLHFERKLIRTLNLKPDARILHQFGGMGEYGLRVDINQDVHPDVLASADFLPFRDNTFDLVISDPPFDEEKARKIWGTALPPFRKYTAEAIRVTKPNGYICLYHWAVMPRLPFTRLVMRIVVLMRPFTRPRVATILQKDEIFSRESLKGKGD